MKLVIETGTESHTSSSASMQAKFRGGPYDGKYLYEVRQFQVKATWDARNDKHQRWVTTEYEIPEGTEIAVIGKGATGSRGSDKHAFHRIYRLESHAEILEEQVDVGLRSCLLKGRLTLVKDVLATQEANAKINTEEGF